MQQVKPRVRTEPTLSSEEDSFVEDVDTVSVPEDGTEEDSLLKDKSEIFNAQHRPNGNAQLSLVSETVHTEAVVDVNNRDLDASLMLNAPSEQIEQIFIEDVPTPTSNIAGPIFALESHSSVEVNLIYSGEDDPEPELSNSEEPVHEVKAGWITPVVDTNVVIDDALKVESSKPTLNDEMNNVSLAEEDIVDKNKEDDDEEISVGHETLEGYHTLSNESEETVEEDEQRGSIPPDNQGYQYIQTEDSQELPSESQVDEFGNALDHQGHPIISHVFPDSWILQLDEGDGIMRFETEDGPVRFIMNLTEGGFNYPNPPNELLLELEVYLKHVPTTHRIAAGCEFFVDTGQWRLQLDSDIANLLLRMDIARDFENITGEVLWNDCKEITIENLTRAMEIYQDSDLDDSPVRLLLANDSVYNPKDAVFRLVTDQKIENITRSVEITDGMDLIKSNVTMSIPSQSDTEVRNITRTIIYEDSILEEQGIRHLDSAGCRVEPTPAVFLVAEDSTLEDQGTRQLLNEDVKLDDQGTRMLIYEDSETVDIVRKVKLNNDLTVDDIKRGHLRPEDSEKIDLKRHLQSEDGQNIEIDRTPAAWTKGQFDGEVVDLKEHRLEMDVKFAISPSKFNLNALEIDEEFLEELSISDDL